MSSVDKRRWRQLVLLIINLSGGPGLKIGVDIKQSQLDGYGVYEMQKTVDSSIKSTRGHFGITVGKYRKRRASCLTDTYPP